mmetsp:Transcript_54305/g.118386  ORF Transcript_54305/g.118386 Transcript_54305/m.118386 type:complete len:295 (+) Transcript_54305:1774-2658(+)
MWVLPVDHVKDHHVEDQCAEEETGAREVTLGDVVELLLLVPQLQRSPLLVVVMFGLFRVHLRIARQRAPRRALLVDRGLEALPAGALREAGVSIRVGVDAPGHRPVDVVPAGLALRGRVAARRPSLLRAGAGPLASLGRPAVLASGGRRAALGRRLAAAVRRRLGARGRRRAAGTSLAVVPRGLRGREAAAVRLAAIGRGVGLVVARRVIVALSRREAPLLLPSVRGVGRRVQEAAGALVGLAVPVPRLTAGRRGERRHHRRRTPRRPRPPSASRPRRPARPPPPPGPPRAQGG